MSPLIRLAWVALCLSVFSPALAKAQEPIPFGESFTLESDALSETRTINIWVPPHADEDPRAPYRVLYLIDGGVDQDWFHITGLAQLGALSWTFDPMIVVGIETSDRQNELTPAASDPVYRSEFPTSGGAEAFRSFITDDVAPFVEANYPTSGETAIIGESLAGLFIVDTFLKVPDAFDDYIAVSPSLWWDNKALGVSAESLIEGGDYTGKRLHIAVADEGGTMQAAIDMVRAAASSAGLDLTYDDLSASETHATVFHRAALNAVRLLYAEPPYDYGRAPWFMIEGASPAPKED